MKQTLGEVLHELINTKEPYKEQTSMKGNDYGWNRQNAMFLHSYAKKPMPSWQQSPLLSARIFGEDYGIPENSDAQAVSWQAASMANPELPLQSALKYEQAYIYPERAEEYGVPLEYLKGHEYTHLLDYSTKLRGGMRHLDSGDWQPPVFAGTGNRGYMPVKRTRGTPEGRMQETPAQIEDWLLSYPERERNQERRAHIHGMQWIGGMY